MRQVHTPVLLQEVVKFMDPMPGKRYIDATVGGAGHSLALLEKGAEVVGIDRDRAILEIASDRVEQAGFGEKFETKQGSFADVLPTLEGEYDGVLFDLGVSSYQLDNASRGFSFRKTAPLDMRMDPDNQQVTAKDLINGLGRKELYELFNELGEERNYRRIADAICDARKLNPIETTTELANLVKSVTKGNGRIHPATKVFQALRMAVNTEREELKAALPSALNLIAVGGVLVVISFHSGEDEIVKDFVRGEDSLTMMLTKPVSPGEDEVFDNPRSRSAKMRVARRTK